MLLQISKQKEENTIQKWANVKIDTSKEKTSKQKHIERHWTALVTRETQINIRKKMPQHNLQNGHSERDKTM